MKENKKVERMVYTIREIQEMLGCSFSKAQRLVQKYNRELKERGALTVSGRVLKDYFHKRYNEDLKEGKIRPGRKEQNN